MQKRWLLKPKNSAEKSRRLRDELGVSPIIAELLVNREIYTFDQARKFFRPSLTDLHDPFLMQDMHQAVDRIDRALQHKEKILIYGDYDVDGTTAVSVVFGFFNKFLSGFLSAIDFYIPDRYEEGYGISYKGIDYAHEHGYSLIIALDCGIKENEKIDYANNLGIDFIIGDHHLPGEELPKAVAVLDPKRNDCNYPYKELSGCGIGFKIIQAFIIKNQMDIEEAYQFLDLVAVSIASDIVPITGENRILAHFGLKKLNTNPSIGLRALIELSTNRKSFFTASDIVFQIGPRINASGRIKHAKDAVNLLIAKSISEAASYSVTVDDQNNQRKDVDLKITEEALEMLDSNAELQARKTTVLFQKHWHKGVIGIVASRLTEKYYRPTIVMTQTNGHIAGSARSVIGFDLYQALQECSDLLEQFGGHKYAAGLTMDPKNLEAFEQRFEEVVSKAMGSLEFEQELHIESDIEFKDINDKFNRILQQFEPFGPQNPQPLFLSSNVSVYGIANTIGGKHLKMAVKQDDSVYIDCIGFGLAEYADLVNSGQAFDICYTIEENTWKNKKRLQLNLKAIRPSQS